MIWLGYVSLFFLWIWNPVPDVDSMFSTFTMVSMAHKTGTKLLRYVVVHNPDMFLHHLAITWNSISSRIIQWLVVDSKYQLNPYAVVTFLTAKVSLPARIFQKITITTWIASGESEHDLDELLHFGSIASTSLRPILRSVATIIWFWEMEIGQLWLHWS